MVGDIISNQEHRIKIYFEKTSKSPLQKTVLSMQMQTQNDDSVICAIQLSQMRISTALYVIT